MEGGLGTFVRWVVCVTLSVDDGKRVKFWKDRWCEESPLCGSSPSYFTVADSKEC